MPVDSAQIALERVLAAVGQCLDRQSAESLLRLRADTEMQGRIEELADKCTEGELTPEERDSMRQWSVSEISLQFCRRKPAGSWPKAMLPDGRAAPANRP